MSDQAGPDPLYAILRDVGEISGVVKSLDGKFDYFQKQLDHKLPIHPTIKLMIAGAMLVAGWLGAITGIVSQRHPTNVTFNTVEPSEQIAAAPAPKRYVKKTKSKDTRSDDTGALGLDILANP